MRQLLFLVFLIPTLRAENAVGFLQIYNFLPEAAHPTSGGEPLTGMIEPRSSSSVMMMKPGVKNLAFQLSKNLDFSVTIKPQEVTTICLYPRYEKTSVIPMATSLPPIDKGLSARLQGPQDVIIKVSEEERRLSRRAAAFFPDWRPQSFTLSLNGGPSQKVRVEESVPHTLLIWIDAKGAPVHALVPHFPIVIPDGLRPDLTFGRQREEIKGLKTLKSRQRP